MVAVSMQIASTMLADMHVNAILVGLATVLLVLISTSALAITEVVTNSQLAQTLQVPLLVNVIQVMSAMVSLVPMSMSV